MAYSQDKPYPGFYDQLNTRLKEDSTSKIKVSAIIISGNKKTKNYIILREMLIKEGDSIIASRLYNSIEQSRNLVYNTNLFSEVEIQPVLNTAYSLTLHVIVKERWYIFPLPQFKLVDRNLNEWLKDYNGSLERVIYGGKFTHYNFSGRGDQLRIFLLSGYARTLSFSYTAPYSNPSLTEGFSVSGGFTQSKEFPYQTSKSNKLLQFKKDGFVRDAFSIGATYRLRRGYFRRHLFSASYNYINVNDSVLTARYNPNYFADGKSKVSYPEFSYTFQYINTDNINYPLKGKIFAIQASKRGLGLNGGLNMFGIDAAFRKYYTHRKNFYSAIELYTKLKLPFKQPYYNQRAMGYTDLYLRGLEYYVIDGVSASIAKYTLSKKLVSFKIPVPFKIKALPYVPFSIFAKTYADLGYSYNRPQYNAAQNLSYISNLNNRFLYSGGFGLDILTLYDFSFRIEYSFNQLGEKGLFLHAKGGF